jgi:CDP-diacylglycerol--serine O-phosphatidyltransferase
MAALKRRPRNNTAPQPRPFRRNKPMPQEAVPIDSRRAARQQFLRKRGIYLLPNAFTTAALYRP